MPKIDEVGTISVSDELLASVVSNSVLGFDGVIGIDDDGAERALDIISRDISVSNGTRISRKDDRLILDVYIIVEFGTKIPKLAWELQKQIQEDIKSINDEEVNEINIHIQGVAVKEKDE